MTAISTNSPDDESPRNVTSVARARALRVFLLVDDDDDDDDDDDGMHAMEKPRDPLAHLPYQPV